VANTHFIKAAPQRQSILCSKTPQQDVTADPESASQLFFLRRRPDSKAILQVDRDLPPKVEDLAHEK
jgi:hypothetical protein